jgi:sugar phosphate isomerase/epimerase
MTAARPPENSETERQERAMVYSGIADEAGKPIEKQLQAHRELGWDHIELRMVGEKNLTDVSDEEFERVLGLVTDAGMSISCFASQLGNWSREVRGDFELDKAELRRAIPRMRKAGCTFIRAMSWKQGDAPADEWKAEAIRRMTELAKMAEDGGVMIVHENCTGWASESPENTIEMIETVNSPGLGVLYDTGNSVGYKKDTMAFLQGVIDRIAYVHIKDMTEEPDGSTHGTFPGEGKSQLEQQLKEILQSGYNGVFSIEPHVASVIHEGKEAGPEELYQSYVKYGRMFIELMGKVQKGL